MEDESQIIWIAGWYVSGEPGEQVWCIKGVYSTEAKAVAACTTANHFVGPMRLDALGNDNNESHWPGSYYPLAAA